MMVSFAQSLATRFATLPEQLQVAARWIADHPQDVALLSMRDQARRAGVQPATMTRLAKALGYDGYDALRAQHAEVLRRDGQGLAATARRRRPLDANSHEAAAQALLTASADQILHLQSADNLAVLAKAAAQIAMARRIYCLGQRSSYPIAWHFHYALSLITDRVQLLDGSGAVGLDVLTHAVPGDVLFVCGVAPYTRAVVEATLQAQADGLRIVAVTDSPMSPLATQQGCVLIAPTESASFLHAMTPAFAIADCLAALVARAEDPAMLVRLEGLDRQLAARNTYLPKTQKGST